jgi:Transposase IS4
VESFISVSTCCVALLPTHVFDFECTLGTGRMLPMLLLKAGPKTTGLLGDDSNSDENDDEHETANKLDDCYNSQKTGSVLLSLIMDMCQPLFGTGRIVNMDNYYTSPTAAWMLSEEKVYMRGTCRTNRKGFPSGVSFNSNEKHNWGRGTIKGMIEKRKRIAAFGWLDGNPVHFITSADGNGVTNVDRRVGRERKTIEAPIGISKYNIGMQAVDRHDQLREGFSLSARHGFKKYYQKIALGLIDMAVVNAWIHYKLVNPEKCSHERARYEFMDSLASSLLDINWQDYHQTAIPGDGDNAMRLILEQKRKRSSYDENDDLPVVVVDQKKLGTRSLCTPLAVHQIMTGITKRKGLSCQVCAFEGRGSNIIRNVVVCIQHRVRACTINRDDRTLIRVDGTHVTDYSWRAPMPTTSCWDKIHQFYIPNGLFRDNVPPMTISTEEDMSYEKMTFQCCCVGSKLYKLKKEAMGETSFQRGRRPKNQPSVLGNSPEMQQNINIDNEYVSV